MKRSTHLLMALAVSVAALIGGSPAAAAPSEGIDPVGANAPPGPLIDPDQQIIDAQASQATTNGVMADAPDPGKKAGSPAEDLAAHPKISPEQHAAEAAEQRKAQEASPNPDPHDDHAHVVTVETLPDGSTGVTIYEPAPGVTPEELADELRAKGKKDVRVDRPDEHDVQPMGPSACAYEHARSHTCPVSYWRNNGHPNPIVRFNDHSASYWPVDAAVRKWNTVANIDSWYHWNSCPFKAGARCVDIYSGNYGQTSWTARAQSLYPTSVWNGAYAEQGHWIQLNNWHPPFDSNERNGRVTHEIGHILGLSHNTWHLDVMYRNWISGQSHNLGGQNPMMLNSIYSIYR